MTHNRIRLLISLSILWATPAPSQDWANWAGPNGNFRVDDAGVFQSGEPVTLKVAWRQPLGTAYSAVSVTDDLAVTTFSDDTSDYVIAFDAENGSERWRYTIGPAYLGHYGSQSGPVATPLIAGGRVILISPQGRLFALDASSGEALWSRDVVAELGAIAPFWGFTASPLLHDGRLIVQMGGMEENAISAFDPESGEVLWSAVSDSVDYQSPVVFRIGGEEQIIFHGTSSGSPRGPARFSGSSSTEDRTTPAARAATLSKSRKDATS